MKKFPDIISVFPLSNFIMFPNTTVPLNIFEPRYIDMINDSMKAERLVGMIQPNYKDDKKNIIAKMEEMKNKKENAQPSRIKTSGSTFKNPVGKSNKKVWELIKESVALDKNFGDAYISEKHCNFFVNKGNAKFEDMKKLIDFVSKSVFKKTGIKLETEIKILE